MCKAIEAYGEEQRLEGKIETAKEMIADNMSVEKIEKYTGLSKEKIKELSQVKNV